MSAMPKNINETARFFGTPSSGTCITLRFSGMLANRRPNPINRAHDIMHRIKNLSPYACIFLVLLCVDVIPADDQLYVAPDGNNSNNGGAKQPLATLQQAQRLVREKVAAGLTDNIIVHVKGGHYWLQEPLVFDVRDSGTDNFSITYAGRAGGQVIISGGRPIERWKSQQDGTWTAQLADRQSYSRMPRHLWINDSRVARARMPQANADSPFWQLTDARLAPDLKHHILTLPPELVERLSDSRDVEIVVLGNWEINRFLVSRVDSKTGEVELQGPHAKGHDAIRPKHGRYCYIENVWGSAIEKVPGSWQFNSTSRTLNYQPLPQERTEAAIGVVPMQEYLVRVSGRRQAPVRNLHFRNIEFRHAAPMLPSGGYQGVQACHFTQQTDWRGPLGRIAAAVQLRYVAGSSFTACRFSQLGGSAIELASGCQDNLIEGNEFFDISGNAIMVGNQRDGKEETPSANRISNNYIHDCGMEYFGAVGIWVGFAQKTRVAHNVVRSMPYTGISVGWQWNVKLSSCRENTVEFNHVYDVTQVLCDGGCLYTLGLQPGTIIRGNLLHDARRSRYAQGAPNNGIFIDEGSTGFLFERNVIYDCSGDAIRFNRSQHDWQTWRDNTFDNPQAAGQLIDKAGLQPGFRHLQPQPAGR